jgi:hypothetical protein
MVSWELVGGNPFVGSSKRDRFAVCVGFHVGHVDSRRNHVGPFCHREDDCNCSGVMPRVSKSAGF